MLAGGVRTPRELVGLLQHVRVHPLLDYLHRPVVEFLTQPLDLGVPLTHLGLVLVSEASYPLSLVLLPDLLMHGGGLPEVMDVESLVFTAEVADD